jgi:hypothetical protein
VNFDQRFCKLPVFCFVVGRWEGTAAQIFRASGFQHVDLKRSNNSALAAIRGISHTLFWTGSGRAMANTFEAKNTTSTMALGGVFPGFVHAFAHLFFSFFRQRPGSAG